MADHGGSGGVAAPELIGGVSSGRWLQAFRGAVDAQREIFAETPDIEGRTEYDGIGSGGDHTLVIDRLCEDAVFAELDLLAAEGHAFLAISEERGEVQIGGPSPVRVVIDPIDGSLNARRTIPAHSLSIAVATGELLEDVELGYVYDFGPSEEWIAHRGGGARREGRPLAVSQEDGLEVVALEATRPEQVIPAAQALVGRAYRIRAPGSIAISICHVAAGRFDGMIGLRPCRSVDAAAAALIAREAGAAVSATTADGSDPTLDLESRFDIAAARTSSDLSILLQVQAAAG